MPLPERSAHRRVRRSWMSTSGARTGTTWMPMMGDVRRDARSMTSRGGITALAATACGRFTSSSCAPCPNLAIEVKHRHVAARASC